jgi:heptosyltransferase-2
VVKPSLAPLIADAAWFDQVIPWDRRESPPAAQREAAAALRGGRFDLGVLFTHSLAARWLLWRAGVRRRVGLAKAWPGLLLTECVSIRAARRGRRFVSKVELYRAMCERLGCADADDQRPEVMISESLRRRADRMLAEAGHVADRPIVGLVPGASYGPSKRWPAERFAAVAERLAAEAGCETLIFTGPGEERLAEQVSAAMRARPLDLPASRDLGLLKALVGRCALLISNDTGPRHVAVALGVPVVTIMGPTDPEVTRTPYERGIVLQQATPCAPCYKRRCPRDHRCMTAVRPEDVFDAARRLLGAHGGSSAE